MNGKTKEYKISRTGRRSLLFHGEEIADSVNGQIQGLVLGVTFFRTENGKIIVLFRSVVTSEDVTSTWNSLVNSVFEQLDLVETID